MRKMLVGLVIAACAAAVFGEGSREAEQSNVIGISKIVAHPALDAVEQGIQDQLADLGYSFDYDLQNANGDVGTAAQIASKFKADHVRVAIGIATPTAQALVNAIDDVPVIYTAVTDPVDAGLVTSYDAGEGNVTGVSDMTPVKAQIRILQQLVDLKTLGHVYTSSEANAVRLAEEAKKACDELGIEFVSTTVTNSAEVRSATQTIVDRVDGLYVSTDNTVVSALSALTQVAMENGVPVMSADPSSAETYDVIAALGFDYYSMGRVTGRLVAEILEGKDPEAIPTQYMTDPGDTDLLINLDVAKRLGITVPASLRNQANKIVEGGQLKTK
jgi:putative ABC transport system substrate-binding protein